MSINVENMRTWVARLRDPDSDQATGVLRDSVVPERKCCLGHACDVSKLGYWNDCFYIIDETSYDANLPQQVAEWLGLDLETIHDLDLPLAYTDPDTGEVISMTAVDLNDSLRLTLPEIADVIEETWPEIREDG